jgi:AcrR family transcriptional regulator
MSAVAAVVRPQALRSRQSILEAVVRLIDEEGAAAVTHQRVAQVAGVGRATVYRHWPEPVDLLLAALERTEFRFMEPGPGSFVQRVDFGLRRAAEQLNAPGVIGMAATILERAQWDPQTKALRDRLVTAMQHNLRIAVDDALAAGELTGAPPVDILLDQLLWPIWGRQLLRGSPITDDLIDHVIDAVVRPWLAERGG